MLPRVAALDEVLFVEPEPQRDVTDVPAAEVVPTDKETSGLAVHGDRPDSEPPQSMLLVVPPERTGTRRVEDLVDQPGPDMAWDPQRLEHRCSVSAATAGENGCCPRRRIPVVSWTGTRSRSVRARGRGRPDQLRRRHTGQHRPGASDLPRVRAGVQQRLVPAAVRSPGRHAREGPGPRGDRRLRRAALDHAASEENWSTYTLDGDAGLLLPPGTPKVAVGPALEEVMLVRDESANLVWGIEQTVRLTSGEGRSGDETAAETLAFRRRQAPPATVDDPHAPIAYQAVSSVPERCRGPAPG